MQRLLASACLIIARPVAADRPKLPPHYAALFEAKHAWTYDVSLTTWDYDKIKDSSRKPYPKATERVVVKCSVVNVLPLSRMIVSEVKCDRDYDRRFVVAGIYSADAAGLHRLAVDAFPHAEADLANVDAPTLIAAKPKLARAVTRDAFFKVDTISGIRKQGAGWCVYSDTTKLADGGPESICYSDGFASGDDDTGGELHHLVWRAR